MTREELNRAVASATGESVREIRRRGFGLALEPVLDHEPWPQKKVSQIDWDEPSAQCIGIFP